MATQFMIVLYSVCFTPEEAQRAKRVVLVEEDGQKNQQTDNYRNLAVDVLRVNNHGWGGGGVRESSLL